MSAKNCTTHHYACECREAKFAEIARDNETLREDLDNAHNTIRGMEVQQERLERDLEIQLRINSNGYERETKLRTELEDYIFWYEAYIQVGNALGINEPELSGAGYFAKCVSELKAENAALRAALTPWLAWEDAGGDIPPNAARELLKIARIALEKYRKEPI